jgi:hypothetical protein
MWLQAWEVVQNYGHGRGQNYQIGFVHSLVYIGESLVNYPEAESLLARFVTPRITHNASGTARLLRGQAE